jgi:hypothetical protein
MKRINVLLGFTVELALLCGLVFACGSNPAPVPVPIASSAGTDELDAAIRETSDYLNKQLPKGNKLMILNVQSEFPALSEYIIDELIANTVNDRVFSVVDRQQLNTIRAELNFQMSGEVDDETAQSLGRMAGAQIIVSGAVSRLGDLYRLRVRALSVQSAQTEAVVAWASQNFDSGEINNKNAIGRGKPNTEYIIKTAGSFARAVAICNNLQVNGYRDWYLPSLDELDLMFMNLHRNGLGGFKNDKYWSSTSKGGYANWIPVWYENFSDGKQDAEGNEANLRVRAIRQF